MEVEYDPALVPERPTCVDCREVGDSCYVGMFRHPKTGEPTPAMTYEIYVTLNDRLVECVAADEERGTVLVVPNGNPDCYEAHYGAVRIYWEPVV